MTGWRAIGTTPRRVSCASLLGLASTDLVFVAGSTMEGEEAAVLAAYNTARRQHRGLRLILVPRHAERFDDVAQLAQAEQARQCCGEAS